MRIIDISQPVGVGIAVWPGDQPFELAWSLRKDRGDSVNAAALTLSVHTGTHTDGGYHVSDDGIKPYEMPLGAYFGKATVVDARERDALDESVLDDVDISIVRRILFRTRETVDPSVFPERFLAPTPGLARKLVDAGIKLIGSDAPSMDDVDSKSLESHHILADGGIATIENLVLSHVKPGEYLLVALPLKLTDADSSPVRAVLIDGVLRDLTTEL